MRPSKCTEKRGAVACMEMRVASMPPNHGSSVRDTSGKHAGSQAQVRREWQVQYLDGTSMLRVKFKLHYYMILGYNWRSKYIITML